MPITIKSKKQKKLEEYRKQLMIRQQKPKRKETPLPKLTPAQKKQKEKMKLKGDMALLAWGEALRAGLIIGARNHADNEKGNTQRLKKKFEKSMGQSKK
jgi:hypothetical protein